MLDNITKSIDNNAETSPLGKKRQSVAAFIFLDLSAGALGMALERRAPWVDLIWMPVQRFGYRQLMYYVVVKSVVSALRGGRVGWGKLERRATVTVSTKG